MRLTKISFLLALLPFLGIGQVKYHNNYNGSLFLEKGYQFSLYDIAEKKHIILDTSHTIISAFDNQGKLLWRTSPAKKLDNAVNGYDLKKAFICYIGLGNEHIEFDPKTRYKIFGNINLAYSKNLWTSIRVIDVCYITPYGFLGGEISIYTGKNMIFIQQ